MASGSLLRTALRPEPWEAPCRVNLVVKYSTTAHARCGGSSRPLTAASTASMLRQKAALHPGV